MIAGIKECFPDYDWQEWLFVCAPQRFWHDENNRRRYIDWLGEQLGFRQPEDWYAITQQHFLDNKGRRLLAHYDDCHATVVMTHFPDHDWKEWLFSNAPRNFWAVAKNRRRYMRWLGRRLGYRRSSDWYAVSRKDFLANRGHGFLPYHNNSISAAVMDHFPRSNWNEWMFNMAPSGFWNCAENRKRYVRWLGKQLRIRRPEDWYLVKYEDFQNNYGQRLLGLLGTHLDVLRECVPELDWDSWRRNRSLYMRKKRDKTT